MFSFNIQKLANNLLISGKTNLEEYLPKIFQSIFIVLFGLLLAYLTHKLIIYIFKKFKIIELIEKFTNQAEEIIKDQKDKDKKELFNKKIKINEIIAKALSYYIFLIFFRLAIVAIGIKEVEDFLGDLLKYLPSLFIAAVIGFFGIRFANFIHDIVYHTLKIGKQKNAKIIGNGIRVLLLFFTLMGVLDRVGIAQETTKTIFIGFISMISIAGGLAYGLGGKELAPDILDGIQK